MAGETLFSFCQEGGSGAVSDRLNECIVGPPPLGPIGHTPGKHSVAVAPAGEGEGTNAYGGSDALQFLSL
jgi:hypothetical protein